MAYTSNPNIPRLRMRAVTMVRRGHSTHEVARYFGYNQSTVARWVQRANKEYLIGSENMPTLSSKPKSHPRALSKDIVEAIVAERLKHHRCAEVIRASLTRQGITVSLSSVKRTLARNELLKARTKWRKKRRNIPRPEVTGPGSLLQIDTIHLLDLDGNRHYVYTIIDLCSRWAYAESSPRISQRISYQFISRAQKAADFSFVMLQADNGPEFGRSLYDQLKAHDITLRHSRVRRSNDNAFIERFNRTIQEESLGKWPSRSTVKTRIPKFLSYYNQERLHISLDYKTPKEVLVMQRS